MTTPSTSGRWLGLAAAAVVVVAGAVALTWNPVEAERSSYPTEASLARPTLEADGVADRFFAAAEAVLQGQGAPDVQGLPAVDGAVALCAYRVRSRPPCGWGDAGTVADSLLAAANDLALQVPKGAKPVLSLDIEVASERVTVGDPGHHRRDPGLWGYVMDTPRGAAVVTPSQVLEFDVFGGDIEDKEFQPKTLLAELMARRDVVDDVSPDTPLRRFRALSYRQTPGGAVRTYRVHGFDRPAVDADALRLRAAWAAEHLASTVEASGRVRYQYDVSKGRETSGYNKLRHGGTTYSLLQAYQRFGHEPWLHASEAAIEWLLRNSKRDVRNGPYGGGDVLWVDESSYVKLGGAGLALVMLTQHMQATQQTTYLDAAQAYARFLVAQQKDDGEFIYFAPRVPGGKVKNRTSAYYPGEAILGLMQLYAIDPDPLWLATAQRGADWLIDVRDEGKGPQDLANDHWLMIALSHLVKHTGDERYVAHSLALADAVAYQAKKNGRKVATHADYFGGYYEPPRSTPAATRGEGLVAVLDTCKLVDRPCDDIRDLLLDTVTHELWSQYTPELSWWMPRPGEVVGGFNGGIVDVDMRNDFTQHNLSSVLGAERHLRDAEGQVLPGGPSWSGEAQAGHASPAPSDVSEWLAPVRQYRGPLRWDRMADRDEEAPDDATE